MRDFDVTHDERMHLIVVRRDLGDVPAPASDAGRRRQLDGPLPLPDAGVYRVFADFSSGGERATLGTDVSVAGTFAPRRCPPRGRRAPTAGTRCDVHEARRRPRLRRCGATALPVADLEPYLGARGHLVALREGDLAFLHVHPDGRRRAGAGQIAFGVEYPSAGRYRLFLQFQHEGVVHTVAFTQEVAR